MCRRWKDVHHVEGVPQGVPRGRDPGLQGLGCLDDPGREGLRYLAVYLKRWLSIDERNSSRSAGRATPATESDALREANKRIKLLEQETRSCVAAAYRSQANLPGRCCTRSSA